MECDNMTDFRANDIGERKRESQWYPFFKRTVDILGSLIGLILLSPIFLIVAIAINLDSKRPIVEKEVALYGEYADKLFSVVPGLTGYWQANGRSDTTYEERIKMDMYYIDNRSLGLDFKIIIKTFGSVIRGDGAV